jgi:hypothetical protein
LWSLTWSAYVLLQGSIMNNIMLGFPHVSAGFLRGLLFSPETWESIRISGHLSMWSVFCTVNSQYQSTVDWVAWVGRNPHDGRHTVAGLFSIDYCELTKKQPHVSYMISPQVTVQHNPAQTMILCLYLTAKPWGGRSELDLADVIWTRELCDFCQKERQKPLW